MSFKSLLNQTISVKQPTATQDRQGHFGLGSAVEMRSRFERTYKTIVTAEKERTPIDAVFAIGPEVTVAIGSQVAYSNELYRVMTRNDVPGRNGKIHHYELMCQMWSYAS